MVDWTKLWKTIYIEQQQHQENDVGEVGPVIRNLRCT